MSTDIVGFFGWGERHSRSAATRTSASRLPVAEPTTESGWQRLREQPRPQDQVLSPLARTWCQALSQRHRPDQLCAQFPRIANRLALCWDDPVLASRLLDSLVMDRRRNRAGFPPGVSQELMQLRLLRTSRPGHSDFAPMWEARGMATCDR